MIVAEGTIRPPSLSRKPISRMIDMNRLACASAESSIGMGGALECRHALASVIIADARAEEVMEA